MKVRFIINPVSGTAGRVKRITGLIRDVLGGENGIFEVKATTGPGAAGQLAREAVDKGYEFVFACGGDGTVNGVASQLVGTGTALGIIPAGSGNALAHTLQIPTDPADAIGLLKTGSVRDIDVGRTCGRYFFTTAGFAFEALLSKKYNEGSLTKKIRGIAPYYVLGLIEYLRFRPERIILEVDGKELGAEPLLLTAANTGQWGGGAFISPCARVDDGLMDFCVFPKTGIFSTLELGYKVMKGRVESYKGFQCIRGTEAVIRGRKATYAHVDGEPFDFEGDIAISILPASLRVLAS
ncbi:MAG: diacylglycerol kinase family lipid kinase [Deltaproteobacteria bacterium]|nr:diacylglycerol kinase family lipid kinase [Deltaproteobacteria bacterium]